MAAPTAKDWSFDELGIERASRLRTAPPFEDIVGTIQAALLRALVDGSYRCGVDVFPEPERERAILQFPVSKVLYDEFFNARTGYRAQFYDSCEQGQAANGQCIEASRPLLMENLPEYLVARKIKTKTPVEYEPRVDIDLGPNQVPSSLFHRSFALSDAKIWICERLICGVCGPLKMLPYLEGPPLLVDRWPGAYAPCPDDAKLAWLELKGAVLGGEQTKDPLSRARQINMTGYT